MLGDSRQNTLIDTLYNGFAGQPCLPDIIDDNTENILLTDQTKQSQTDLTVEPGQPPPQISAAEDDTDRDIRPRFYDLLTQQWILD